MFLYTYQFNRAYIRWYTQTEAFLDDDTSFYNMGQEL